MIKTDHVDISKANIINYNYEEGNSSEEGIRFEKYALFKTLYDVPSAGEVSQPPDCGPCQLMTQDYLDASKEFDSYDDLMFAEINVAENKTIAEKYGVTYLPALKFFVHGVAHDYTGRKKKENIVQWVALNYTLKSDD